MQGWELVAVVALVVMGARGIARAVAAGITAARRHQVAAPDEGLRVELEDLRNRVMELEERQDFTERVLTRGSQEGGAPHAS